MNNNIKKDFNSDTKIHLKDMYHLKNDPILEVMIPYIKDENNHEVGKAIIILPGGAYSYTSKREGDPVATSLNGGQNIFTPLPSTGLDNKFFSFNGRNFYGVYGNLVVELPAN